MATATAVAPKATKAAAMAIPTIGSKSRLAVGSFAVAAMTGIITKLTLSAGNDAQATGGTEQKLNEHFPGAITNQVLVKKVSKALKPYDFGRNSLVATSLCNDEVKRCLESEFAKVYGNIFCMGGLAGFPFGGSTAFGNMASHLPPGESALIVFAPHVGIDSEGGIGDFGGL